MAFRKGGRLARTVVLKLKTSEFKILTRSHTPEVAPESCDELMAIVARPCKVPGDIEPIEYNPVVRCQHCEDTRQYLDKDCFLAPLSAAGSSDKSGGTVAVVAGLIAAAKLARVESIELQNRSPRDARGSPIRSRLHAW